jgi:hypothetical protein
MRLRADDSLVVGYVSDFYVLLRAIDEAMPTDAVLCLQGTTVAPDVREFLEQRQAADRPAIKPNSLWPKPRFFHLPLTGTNLAELRSLADQHAEPEVTDHLVVYRENQVLLWAHDAGDGYVALSLSARGRDQALPRSARRRVAQR